MTYDLFVAGLGVTGGALARAAARAGLSVVGCDALNPPHDQGSSHGESRIIRAAYFEDPVYAPLAQRALMLWRELEGETGRSLLRITGGLNIGPANAMLVEGASTSARLHDIAHERLDADELELRFPGLRVPPGQVGIFEPDAGVLDPEASVAAQLESARAAGAELRSDESLLHWKRSNGGFLVTTAAGEYRAGALVLAVGAWLPRFAPGFSLEIARQPVFWFEPIEPALYQADRLPHYLIEFERARVFYGFPDLGHGLKCAIHHEGDPTLPEAVDRSVRHHELEEVRKLVARYLPGAAGPLRRASVCLYTNTRDGHFVIAEDPNEAGLWRVSACSGHGFKFAPAVAELALASIMNNAAVPAVFSTQRFLA